jgi:hypothetical protein
MVKNSNLPSSIKKDRNHLPAGATCAKFSVGPTFPNPGPMLPRLEATAPIEVSMSGSKKVKIIVLNAKMKK